MANDTKRILLVGDYTDAPWHPLEPAQRELESILEGWTIRATEDYDAMASLSPEETDLFISYTDCWSRDLTPAQTAGVLRYVAGGGGALILHNGISLQRSPELIQMVGAKFTEHPPYQRLTYHEVGDGHPVMEGVGGFEMDEEPYLFEFDPYTPKNVFLEYEFEGNRYPAGWSHPYGLGRVLYLQPGHHAPSFQPEAYRELIRRSVRWAAGLL